MRHAARDPLPFTQQISCASLAHVAAHRVYRALRPVEVVSLSSRVSSSGPHRNDVARIANLVGQLDELCLVGDVRRITRFVREHVYSIVRCTPYRTPGAGEATVDARSGWFSGIHQRRLAR